MCGVCGGGVCGVCVGVGVGSVVCGSGGGLYV